MMEEEIDIYGDLDHLDEDKLEITPQVTRELQQENAELQKKIEELSSELERITKYSKSLEANISSLHKTAKVEIARKDRMITDLRQQLDNAAFRRNTNFRIPKRIPRPSVISLPPKDESTCTEIKKEEVNNTINKEETEYQSPLITNDEDFDDAENLYQPENLPLTVFGERLKRKIEQESREEAEASENVREEQAQQSEDIGTDKAPEVLENIDTVQNKEDKENKYRLIPLTLQRLAENSRKRGSDSVEKSEEQDYSRPRDSHENKRRKFDNSESRRDQSPDVDRYKNSTATATAKSVYRKRMKIKAEYYCPGKPNTHDNSRHQKTPGSSCSRSRSKSRERRDRRDPHSSLDRRKDTRGRSKTPPRGHDSEKGKYRSSRKASDDRYGERRGEKSRNSKRPVRKDVTPPVKRMDLRRRLDRRNDGRVDCKIQDEMRKRTHSGADARRNNRLRRSREVSKNNHVSKSEINDSKHPSRLRLNVNGQRDVDRTKSERSKSPSTERRRRNSSDEKIKTEPPKESEEIVAKDKMPIDRDDIEEGEIPDSPCRESPDPARASTTNKIKLSPSKDDQLHPEVNGVEPHNLDDSLREEKIENIELFIEKLQSNDREFFQEQTRIKNEKLQSLSSNQLGIVSDSKQITSQDRKANVEIISAISKKDTSDESVHLTSILGDSSDEEVCESALNAETAAISDNEVERKMPDTAHNVSHSLDDLIPNGITKKSEIVGVPTDASADQIPEAIFDDVKTSPKDDAPQSTIFGSTSPATENDSIEKISKSCPKLLEALQTPRAILQEIDSLPKTKPLKPNEPHLQKSVPKEKENSGAKTDRIIVVARRRKVRLTDISTSMTVVVSEKNTDENQ
ncbi:titin homolog [Diachasma alloeum]|uniref:titin homolog n=1 Tax=Diachasma alloeum TaxID=454923 RepID=UPI000738466E|nr:titin homolog [Diachasma alloeum]